MRQFNHGNALGPEKKKKRNNPEPDRDAAIRSDGGNHVEVEHSDDEKQNEVPSAENALEMGYFARFGDRQRRCNSFIRQKRYLAPQTPLGITKRQRSASALRFAQ